MTKRKPHPNSLANLRPPWKKGEYGNPQRKNVHKSGRYKITDKLRQMVEESGDDKSKSVSQQMVEVAVKCALDGDYRFWKDITDRLDGTALQRVQATVASQDTPEMAYMTDEELSTLSEIFEKAKQRMKEDGNDNLED